MRAQKNHVEREGMRKAHIRDAVAMCDTFSYLEERVSQREFTSLITICLIKFLLYIVYAW